MDYAKFEQVVHTVAEVFATWDENMKDFTNVAREGELSVTNRSLTSSLSKTGGEVHLDQDQSRSRPTPRTHHISWWI